MKSRFIPFLLALFLLVSPAPVRAFDWPAHPEGTVTIDQKLGVSRQDILNVLKSHAQDDYYLGTPFWSGSTPWTPSWCCRPQGRYKGNSPQMNCAGFVSDVFIQAGVSKSSLRRMVKEAASRMDFDTDGSYINVDSWFFYILTDPQIQSYHFDTVEEALNSGKLRKGDLVCFHPKPYVLESGYDIYGNEADPHIGFFWGSTSKENRFWHSSLSNVYGLPGADSLKDGNQISRLVPCCDSSVYVFPLSSEVEAPYITGIDSAPDGVTLRWDKVASAKSYRVYRKQAGSSWQVVKTVKAGEKRVYKDTDLQVGETYRYAVQACVGKRKSPLDKGKKAGLSARLTMVSSTGHGNRLRWKKTRGAEGYKILRRTKKTGWQCIQKIEGNSTFTFVDETARRGATYYYSIKAVGPRHDSLYDKNGLKIKTV